jgi:hypothetical protein
VRQFSLHTNLNSTVRPSTELSTSLNYVTADNHLGADFGASPLLGAQVGHRLLFTATRGFFAVPPEVPQQLYDNSEAIDRFTGSGTITNRPTSWFTQRAIVGLDYAGSDARALERFAPPDVAIAIDCGKGTYVRSIAHALGGHCATLRRTRVGPFAIDDADEQRLVAPVDALPFLPAVRVSAEQERALRAGRAVGGSGGDGLVRLVDDAGALVAVGRAGGDSIRPETVLPA